MALVLSLFLSLAELVFYVMNAPKAAANADLSRPAILLRSLKEALCGCCSPPPPPPPSSATVAVIRLHGEISLHGEVNYFKNRPLIDRAFKTKNLKAVLLSINSSSGSPGQCRLISSYLRAMAEKKKVPVYAFVEDEAASGGYWLACCGEKIFVSPGSVVGGIGVIVCLMDKKGRPQGRPVTAGEKKKLPKSLLDRFKPLSEFEQEQAQKKADEWHEVFKDWVTKQRGDRLKHDKDNDLFTGESWIGQKAVDLGLVDGIDDVHSWVRKEYGKDAKVEEYGKKVKLRRSDRLQVFPQAPTSYI